MKRATIIFDDEPILTEEQRHRTAQSAMSVNQVIVNELRGIGNQLAAVLEELREIKGLLLERRVG